MGMQLLGPGARVHEQTNSTPQPIMPKACMAEPAFVAADKALLRIARARRST